MKRTHLIFTALLLLAQISCGEKTAESSNNCDIEAAAIADSIKEIGKLKKYIEHYDSLNEKRASLLIRQKLGSMHRNKSDFDSAIAVHEECIKGAKELKDTLQLIIALNNQGTNFRRIGDLEEASIYHYAALDLCESTANDTSYTARKNRVRTFNGLGNVMLSLGNYEVAEELFHRALKGERELGSATGQAINYANIGAIKEIQGNLDSARICYSLSMEKNIECNNRVGISLCYQNIGELEEIAGNYNEARNNYIKSYNIGLETRDIWHWLNPCMSLAGLSLKEGNIRDAEKYCSEALQTALRIKAKGRLSGIYSLQSQIDERNGDFEKALENKKKSIAYKDSAEIDDNRVKMQNLRVNHEISKRKKEVEEALAQAEHEKEMFNIFVWSSIVVLLLILIAIATLVRASLLRKRANALLEKTNRERQDFYRGITHQLRTPLTVVLGMTHELKRFIPNNNEAAQKEFDAAVRKSGELLTLVNEMIEYNKGERDEVEINELNKSRQEMHTKDDSLSINEKHGGDLQDYVLVAEDDKDVALLITQMLKNEGYSFCWAGNGKEALDFIAQKQPMLVITDIMMPEIDGLELIKAIKANKETSHLPIIVVSARTENNDRLAGFDAGAEVYLGKPFIPDELLLMVRKLLEQREILKKKYSQQIEDADNADHNDTIRGIRRSEQEFIKQVNEYIHDNIMDCNLNAAMLASHMIMSISTLNRKINSITGSNTTIYIRQRKLARAKYLLRNSNMSMGEIQAVCGFETPSYFSRAFKAEFNITPTEYRKNQ